MRARQRIDQLELAGADVVDDDRRPGGQRLDAALLGEVTRGI